MAGLDLDSPLLHAKMLSGVHEDAVRCIYDERLNRLKPLKDCPDEQLRHLCAVADDAFDFWKQVSVFKEDYARRRKKVSEKLGLFFERVARYAHFHGDENLTGEQVALKREAIRNAYAKKDALII